MPDLQKLLDSRAIFAVENAPERFEDRGRDVVFVDAAAKPSDSLHKQGISTEDPVIPDLQPEVEVGVGDGLVQRLLRPPVELRLTERHQDHRDRFGQRAGLARLRRSLATVRPPFRLVASRRRGRACVSGAHAETPQRSLRNPPPSPKHEFSKY